MLFKQPSFAVFEVDSSLTFCMLLYFNGSFLEKGGLEDDKLDHSFEDSAGLKLVRCRRFTAMI